MYREPPTMALRVCAGDPGLVPARVSHADLACEVVLAWQPVAQFGHIGRKSDGLDSKDELPCKDVPEKWHLSASSGGGVERRRRRAAAPSGEQRRCGRDGHQPPEPAT